MGGDWGSGGRKGGNLDGHILELHVLKLGAFDIAARGGRVRKTEGAHRKQDVAVLVSSPRIRRTHTRKSLRVKIFLKRGSATILLGGMSLKPVSLHMRLPTRCTKPWRRKDYRGRYSHAARTTKGR
jgi:hypothetical protein